MADDASDVTKALAAFGAPSIRYHSFGQSAMRSSTVPLERRPVITPLAPLASPPMVQQAEPVAAPELTPLAMPPIAPIPVLPPRPAPVASAALAAQTVAPPPRPLAEWAAPASGMPLRPIVPPPVPERTPSALLTALQHNPLQRPADVQAVPPPLPVGVTGRRFAGLTAQSSLPDIFDYLATS